MAKLRIALLTCEEGDSNQVSHLGVRTCLEIDMRDPLMILIRVLFLLPRPKVTPEEAMEIAYSECRKRNIEVTNMHIVERLRSWDAWPHWGFKGSTIMVIDNQNGEIKKVGSLPR